jgi:hypothetical protein
MKDCAQYSYQFACGAEHDCIRFANAMPTKHLYFMVVSSEI